MSLFVYVGVASFAIIWNLMVCCCYGCDRKMKPAIKLLLQALLWTDVAMMAFNIVVVIVVELAVVHPSWIADSEFRRLWLPFVAHYSLPGFYVAHMASVWMVIVISVDRFLAVYHRQVSAKYMSSKWQTGAAVVGVWFGSTLINLPRFFEYQVSMVGGSDHDEVTNRTAEVTFTPTWLVNNAVYDYVYDYSLYALIMIVLPFGSLAFVHLKLASVTRQLRRIASSAAGGSSTSCTCLNCCGGCTVSAPFTFVVCVLFQVSPVVVIVVKLVNRFSEVNIPALLGCSSIELTFNAVSRFFVYVMFSRYIYVDACQTPLEKATSVSEMTDVETAGDEDNGKESAKEALMTSQTDLNGYSKRYAKLPQLQFSEKWTAPTAEVLPGSANFAYESACTGDAALDVDRNR